MTHDAAAASGKSSTCAVTWRGVREDGGGVVQTSVQIELVATNWARDQTLDQAVFT